MEDVDIAKGGLEDQTSGALGSKRDNFVTSRDTVGGSDLDNQGVQQRMNTGLPGGRGTDLGKTDDLGGSTLGKFDQGQSKLGDVRGDISGFKKGDVSGQGVGGQESDLSSISGMSGKLNLNQQQGKLKDKSHSGCSKCESGSCSCGQGKGCNCGENCQCDSGSQQQSTMKGSGNRNATFQDVFGSQKPSVMLKLDQSDIGGKQGDLKQGDLKQGDLKQQSGDVGSSKLSGGEGRNSTFQDVFGSNKPSVMLKLDQSDIGGKQGDLMQQKGELKQQKGDVGSSKMKGGEGRNATFQDVFGSNKPSVMLKLDESSLGGKQGDFQQQGGGDFSSSKLSGGKLGGEPGTTLGTHPSGELEIGNLQGQFGKSDFSKSGGGDFKQSRDLKQSDQSIGGVDILSVTDNDQLKECVPLLKQLQQELQSFGKGIRSKHEIGNFQQRLQEIETRFKQGDSWCGTQGRDNEYCMGLWNGCFKLLDKLYQGENIKGSNSAGGTKHERHQLGKDDQTEQLPGGLSNMKLGADKENLQSGAHTNITAGVGSSVMRKDLQADSFSKNAPIRSQQDQEDVDRWGSDKDFSNENRQLSM